MEKLDLRYGIPDSLTFCTFSSDDIKKLSVVKIVTPLSFNALGHPLPGGLYDPALGPMDSSSVCGTCNMKMYQCPGHFGSIELPLPVINPLYHKVITSILKVSCLNCHRVLLPGIAKCVLKYQMKLLEKGFFVEAMDFGNSYSNNSGFPLSFKTPDNSSAEMSIQARLEEQFNDICRNEIIENHAAKGEGELRKLCLNTAFSFVHKGKSCPLCRSVWRKVQVIRDRVVVPETAIQVADKFQGKVDDSFKVSGGNFKFLTPKDCRDHLIQIWENDSDVLKALVPMLGKTTEPVPLDSLFMNHIFVSPTNARPCNFLDGMITEHPQNYVYKAILNDCLVIRSIILLMNSTDGKNELIPERQEVVDKLRGSDLCEKLHFAWLEMQRDVDALFDIDVKRNRSSKVQGIGLKQIIEKKHGILRMNMMGKRVNFAARTVITPDPNLNIDEIGIPEAFAKKLTYPVVVTAWNVAELRKIVMNGPEIHPGANFIVDESKKIIKINKDDPINRESLAKRLLTPGDKPGFKVVHRHLINGDILLLNRQPTLHKPSIMAHKARILKGEKTFRLHYANCKSYNADFDGDEMNAHFPQNEVARSEGYNLVSVNKQYLVPKDGTPLSGLIQDHMVSGVRLTMRGKMFSKSQYMLLVYQALANKPGDITLLKPCIIKPVQLWSGKQIVSTVLLNLIPTDKVPINLTSKAKISSKAWIKGSNNPCMYGGTPLKNDYMTEAEVVIRNGELLSGVLDKTHYGATPYCLVHCIYELYGSDVSSTFLSSLAKLFTAFLQLEGFTLGVEDILVLKNADSKRDNIIEKCRKIGNTIVQDIIDVPIGSTLEKEMAQKYAKDPTFRNIVDHKYKTVLDQVTNDINKACIPHGLLSPFPSNNLQLMVQSGAKGSTVNTMQISCLLGQIELEGKRPPLMVSGKSLPSFPSFETSPRSGGFVDGRFMTGIKPQEFFFHCMAGREGLIDTAVKTSRSGYLQRCLVKHLEGLNVNYDLTVRDSDGSVVQFLYGEDGLDVTKCQFLKDSQIPFLIDNVHAVSDHKMIESIKQYSDLDAVSAYNKKIKKWKKNSALSKSRQSGFALFSEEMKNTINKSNTIVKETGRSALTLKLCKMWADLSPEEKSKYERKYVKSPDTVVSKFQPDRHYGAITEKMDQLINNYFEKMNRNGDIKEKRLRALISEKYLTSLSQPGEAVGLLAAQSVGEPSTQMTLNTFHFAGRGEMNVTLGIPRLREILMVASKNIKTPSMTIHFKEVPKLDNQIKKLKKKLTRVTLADVLEIVRVHETFQMSPRRKVFNIRMEFLPHEAYIEDTSVTPKQILKYVEKKFLKNFFNCLQKKSGKRELITENAETGAGGKADGGGSGDEEDEEVAKTKKEGSGAKRSVTQDDYQSSDDEPEADDDDATTARRRAQHEEEHQYSDVEDDASVEGGEVGLTEDADEDWLLSETQQTDEEPAAAAQSQETEEEKQRLAKLKSHHFIIDYKYDKLKEEWCEITFGVGLDNSHVDISSKLTDICRASVIHEVSGIRKAFIQTDNTTGRQILKTDGFNLNELMKYDKLIDFNKLYSNDIHAMASLYGIEAASSIIVKEVQLVFKDYGIIVDPRHLSLIASYMTFSGAYLPLSRTGMEGGASPLQQMSFEASLLFLKSAVSREKRDDLCSPSSRLMLGAPIKSGTGSFRLLQTLSA